ncbi:hypothetical protein TSH100_08335 [Azospirillum sp. TSH100]|nr:hypothetical protein TSH100_08335 [Azospirillum sp. TSH100]
MLARAGRADIRLDPFPHIVIPDVLEAAGYAQLAESYPGFGRIGWDDPARRIPSNQRFMLGADMIMADSGMPDCWRAFAARHSGPEFLAEVEELFAGHWHPALRRVLDGRLTGHTTARLSFMTAPPGDETILQDARIEINTPVSGKASVSRGAHLDTPNRLFTGLLYFRDPADDSVGGELVLYRWRDGVSSQPFAFQQPAEAVEEVVRIPYRANQLVMFPQGIHALHGVGMRHPTPHMRRYVFITAELRQDWLADWLADGEA